MSLTPDKLEEESRALQQALAEGVAVEIDRARSSPRSSRSGSRPLTTRPLQRDEVDPRSWPGGSDPGQAASRVVSSIVFVIRNCLRWRNAPKDYGLHKDPLTIVSSAGAGWAYSIIFAGLAGRAAQSDRLMIDATHLKAHRTAASLLKRAPTGCLGRTKGGLNSKLHAFCDSAGGPLIMLLSEGQMSDHKRGPSVAQSVSGGENADRRSGSNCFRAVLQDKCIAPCIPSTRSRKVPRPYDKTRYKQRHRIENSFDRLNDRRRIAMRNDRCARTFSSIFIAAIVCFSLSE